MRSWCSWNRSNTTKAKIGSGWIRRIEMTRCITVSITIILMTLLLHVRHKREDLSLGCQPIGQWRRHTRYDPPFFTLSLPVRGPIGLTDAFDFYQTKQAWYTTRQQQRCWCSVTCNTYMTCGPPIIGPFPYITNHMIQSIAVHRCSRTIARTCRGR